MLNLLEKFENVEIKNTERISQEDFDKMEQWKQEFELFKSKFYQYEMFYKNNPITAPLHDREVSYSDIQPKKMLRWLYENFMIEASSYISRIYYYFSKKYNVRLDNNFKEKGTEYYEGRMEESQNRLKFYLNFEYNMVIDDIYEQLGGFNFNEKAVQELKENTRSIYYYNDYGKSSNMKVKKNKLIINGGFAYKDSIWNEYRLSNSNTMSKIFTSLYHFDNNTIVKNDTELHNKYCGYQNERNLDNFEKYEPKSLEKVKSIKIFKNGKMEIQFNNSKDALIFAKEYCGYIE